MIRRFKIILSLFFLMLLIWLCYSFDDFYQDCNVTVYRSNLYFLTLRSSGESSDLNQYEHFNARANLITVGFWNLCKDTIILEPQMQIDAFSKHSRGSIIPISLPDTLRNITSLRMTLLIKDNGKKLLDITEYGRVFPDFYENPLVKEERFIPIIEYDIVE